MWRDVWRARTRGTSPGAKRRLVKQIAIRQRPSRHRFAILNCRGFPACFNRKKAMKTKIIVVSQFCILSLIIAAFSLAGMARAEESPAGKSSSVTAKDKMFMKKSASTATRHASQGVPHFVYKRARQRQAPVLAAMYSRSKATWLLPSQTESFHLMRKSKIICTLGPATEKTEALRQLIQRGTDVFRLNMSHATHEWVREIVPRIRRLAQAAGRPVAILLDTQGPAIRTGDLKTNLNLKPGDILEFTARGAKSKEQYSVDVNYAGFVKDVSVG